MTISVCMIVKNEEKLLRRCLDSLVGLYDELVIVDTGSTDKTKEIAWEYTNDVYDFEWVNDFAAARNFAFSKCTKEYIYSADADEVIDEVNREQFKVLTQYLDPNYEIVRMWYLTPLDFNEANGFAKEYRPKLFKRLRNWTWIDPVHESMRLEPTVFDSDISIRHLPSVSHADRDFEIYEKAASRGGILSPKLHALYARELYLNGDKDELLRSKEYFRHCVDGTLFTIRNDVEPQRKKKKASLWTEEAVDTKAEEKLLAADEHFNVYRQSLCILAKIARVEEDYERLFEISMIAMTYCPCSEIALEVGIGYYELEDSINAKNWLNIAMHNTSPSMDPAAGNTKALKYLDLIENGTK